MKSSTDELLQELSQNQSNLESIEDSKALQIYQHEQQISSLDNKTASFISYKLLLEILISPHRKEHLLSLFKFFDNIVSMMNIVQN